MSSTVFQFGEQRAEFPVLVLNERAVRASAGILLFFAMISFMNAWLVGNFLPTKVFVIAFLIEFTVRIFVNPRLAPVMIVGAWVVRKQQPEWVGAPQKRFAWAIGWGLAITMSYLMVFNSMVGPANLLVCATCLLLMLFESAFGICVGCKVYNWFNKNQAQLCPGGVCDMPAPAASQGAVLRGLIVLAFAFVVAAVANGVYAPQADASSQITPKQSTLTAVTPSSQSSDRCKVPDFAKAMGHEEKWKLHNNCQ